MRAHRARGPRHRAAAAPGRLRPGRVRHGLDADLDRVRRRDRRRRPASKAEVAAITEAAMRGEIADYKESLRRRVALLKGVPASALQRVYDERLRFNPGAERARRRVQGGGPEDAARLGRLHLLHRPRPRPARLRLHAQQRPRDRATARLYRPHGRPALGRHLRRRREAEDAARDLRRARASRRRRRSPSATAPTTCR